MTQVRAGFARRDITQPLGSPSSLGLNVAVAEIWDPLTATACVLESDGQRIAIVGVDLCGLLEGSHQAIRERVAASTRGAIRADHVVVNVSHTHSAPYLSDELQDLLRPFGLRLQDNDYAASLPGLVADAVVEAADRAVPVSVSVGRGRVEHVAGNRRPRREDGRVVHRWGRPPQELRDLPEGLIDPEVAVVRFEANGAAAGALMVYACHPTASSEGIPSIVSADYPGHARATLEREFGHPFVFLQGCAGNVGTGKWVAGTPLEDTVAMGARFAAGVADGLRAARAVDAATLAVAVSELPLELEAFAPVAEMERQLAAAVPDGSFGAIVAIGDALVVARRLEARRRARITALSLGPDLALVVLPGEVFLEHGLAVRAESPFRETIVAAYNANTLQYIPTREAFPDGEYEVNGGWRYIRPGEGERMSAEAVRLLRELTR
jgi:neutral/alkaline ceramidase-like enzyme